MITRLAKKVKRETTDQVEYRKKNRSVIIELTPPNKCTFRLKGCKISFTVTGSYGFNWMARMCGEKRVKQ